MKQPLVTTEAKKRVVMKGRALSDLVITPYLWISLQDTYFVPHAEKLTEIPFENLKLI